MAPFFPFFSPNNPKFNTTAIGSGHPSGGTKINSTANGGLECVGAGHGNFIGGNAGENPFEGGNPFNGTHPFQGGDNAFNDTIPFRTSDAPIGSGHNVPPTTLIHATFNVTSIPKNLSLRAALPQPTPTPSGTTTTTATISALATTLPTSYPPSLPNPSPSPDLQISHSLPLGYYPWSSWGSMPNTKLILTLLLLTIISSWVGVEYCAWRREKVRKYGKKLQDDGVGMGKGGKWHLRWWNNGGKEKPIEMI